MPLSRDIIDRTLGTKHGERAFQVTEILLEKGFDAWWVGGGVRDMLRRIVPKDIDIASDALPEEIMKLFPKNNDIGARFGSVIVSHKGSAFEITTFREDDAASDGRHPESVRFGKRETDAKRRDFTVNAMYWQPLSRDLFDPYGGEQDLKERLIRFVGKPEERIRHDALRLFRAVRFRALLEGQYHPDTYQALQNLSSLSADLSGVRIVAEMEKMLLGPHPDRGLEDLWETGILKATIPELYACKGVAQPADYHHEGDVWAHIRKCAASFSADHGADVRWSAVFHDIGKTKTFALKERIRFDHHAQVGAEIIREVFKRFQFPKMRTDKIAWMVEHHMMMGSFDTMPTERKAHWYYHPWFMELLQLMWLDVMGTDPGNFELYESIVSDYNHFLDEHPRPPKALLSGDEVMELLGLKPGEEVGKILKQLYDAQVKKEIMTKKEAIEYLQQLSQKL